MKITWKPSRRLAAVISAAALISALAASAEHVAPPLDPAPGQLLIASAAMRDPRFQHSVILMVRHDKNGAFGIAINRPLGERPIADLLSEAAKNGGKDDSVEGKIRVFLGGPVQPQYGFVIHGSDYRRPETLAVGDRLAMTASRDVLRDIGQHKGPAKYLFALGYAGWGAGQLEGEIARRDWFTVPADPELVFDTERGAVWEKAVARRTREL